MLAIRMAVQFTNVRRLFCSGRHRLLEHSVLERAEKPSGDRELHFLRRMEPAIRSAALFYDGNGFLARQTNGQGHRAPFAAGLVDCQRLHESQHARVL
jgi:hypothetical protein